MLSGKDGVVTLLTILKRGRGGKREREREKQNKTKMKSNGETNETTIPPSHLLYSLIHTGS